MDKFSYWVEAIIFLLGSLAVLLIGFELLSNSASKLFHKGLKKLFNKTSKSKLIGVGIGAGTTAIMQSSAATTIMVVGFVNTGLMSLQQATAVIMGANIGTTITAQLASLSSFNFGSYAIITAIVGVVINMFAKKDRTKSFANLLCGFGLLFLGLKCISLALDLKFEGVPLIKETISNLLININGWYAPVAFFILGIVLTALCHSSALITTIIISLAGTGIYIGAGAGATELNNNVLYLILGTNIGTCITAMISSVGASTNAKRASMIHLWFNTFGAILFIIVFLIFPNFMKDTFVKAFPGEPAVQIAMFHTGFNLACTIAFLPFINLIVKTSELLVKDKTKDDKELLKYIDTRFISTPSIATHQVRLQLSEMLDLAVETLSVSLDGFFNGKIDVKDKVDEMNSNLSYMSKAVTEYMIKISTNVLSFEDECTISEFYKTLHDVVRIGEIGDNVCKYTIKLANDEIVYSEYVMNGLMRLKDKVFEAYNLTSYIFKSKNISTLKDADNIEDEIDTLRKYLTDEHYDRLNQGKCQDNNGVYVNFVNNLERAGDHINYIAHSVEDALLRSKGE